MECVITDFGGVLLRTGGGDLAVNAGALPRRLAAAYLRADGELKALVLTSEHVNRSHGAAPFAEERGIPVIVSLAVSAHCRDLTMGGRRPITFLIPAGLEFAGAELRFYRLWNDSLDPCFLTVEADGRRIGIVPDGRLDAVSVCPLLECDEVLLGNRLNLPPDSPGALARRLRSVSNTDAELDALFRGYAGKLVRL